MRTTISLCVVIALSLLGARSLTAQSVELVNSFDYPGSVYSLDGTGQINDNGSYVGVVRGGGANLSGFRGNVDGYFSPPFVLPNNPLQVTAPLGINNSGLICGFYHSTSGFIGFFHRGSQTKSYMGTPTSVSTTVESVNDAEHFVGQILKRHGKAFAYVVLNRHPIPISIDSVSARASGINNLDEVVGSYDDATQENTYGFFRAADGTLTLGIAFPAAVQTQPTAINDAGYIVGFWVDADQSKHGFVIKLPDTFINYDVPDSENTVLTGINNSGQIIGWYQDAQFVPRGLVAQLIE